MWCQSGLLQVCAGEGVLSIAFLLIEGLGLITKVSELIS